MSGDTFVFNPATDSFKYLRTNTAYINTPGDITTLLSLASTATPLLGGGAYNYAIFNAGSAADFLYLIWDFRSSNPVDLCFSSTSTNNACCKCEACDSLCSTWRFNSYEESSIQFYDCDTNEVVRYNAAPEVQYVFCSRSWYTPTIIAGEGRLQLLEECGCGL